MIERIARDRGILGPHHEERMVVWMAKRPGTSNVTLQ